MIDHEFIKKLRCPIDGQPLILSDDKRFLVNQTSKRRYPIEDGIAILLAENAQSFDDAQQFDK